MAVTPVGNPYVESSDLVANYPGASEALAERIDIVGVNPFADAAARDAAIPSPVQGQMCSLNDDNKGYRYDGSAWVLFSGAGDANFTNAATGTYTDGDDYKYITFTGSGSLVVDKAGFADVLVIGGGGGGGNLRGGGGGAGGNLVGTSVYLSEATHTVTVGAGGIGAFALRAVQSGGGNGISSRVGNYYGVGGGGGGGGQGGAGILGVGQPGGSGGGGGSAASAGGSGLSGQGNAGGTGYNGGGGGSGAVGANGLISTGGNGGAGTSSSITGSPVTRTGGGGGGSEGGTAGTGGSGGGGAGTNNNTTGGVGTINSGSGGGGGGFDGGAGNGGAGGNGGSGLVIVRVVV